MKALKIAVIFGLAAGTASAQDFQRGLELPSHQALMNRINGSPDLAPFTTDGCSGGLSSTWKFVANNFPEFAKAHEGQLPWEECCVIHDRAYHNAGGTADAGASYDARLEADEKLRSCVIEFGAKRQTDIMALYDVTEDQIDTAYDAIGGAMFMAVRFGGAPCSGLPWRWGYGYEQCSIFTTAPITDNTNEDARD